MHELFAKVLAKKDLSKAGELFSLEDEAIEKDLEEIIQHIREIADTDAYESNDNDQSVVEICITRITTAIRETERIEKHVEPLVSLLPMCLKHNLAQKSKDEDPPHAKIASDVMSRLFSYYSNDKVMSLAIPAVVQFLDCNNKDLVRSVASYLSLATIDNSSLLAQHMILVLSSVLKGNYLLGQVLPQIYEQNPQPVLEHVDELAELLKKCDSTEKVCFIQLFNKVAKTHPELLEKHVPQFCKYLSSSLLSSMILMILVDMAMARPEAVVSHLPTIQSVVDTQPMLIYQVAQITSSVGTISKEEGKNSMDFLVSKLAGVDQSMLPSVLQEIRGLGLVHNSLLSDNIAHISKLSTSGSSAVRIMVQHILEDVRKFNSTPTSANRHSTTSTELKTMTNSSTSTQEETREGPKEMRSVSSQTEGTVTIITVGNPPNATHPSGTVSVKSTTLPSSGESSQQSLAKVSRLSSGDHGYSPAHAQTPEANSYASVGTSTDNIGPSEAMRDGVQLFCEKHFTKIKNFINKLNATIPLPVKISVVNGKHKRYLKLHFECANKSEQCLYSGSNFALNTRLPKLWVHLKFLSVQAQSKFALSQRDVDVSCLKVCWDALKGETSSSFLALVTSSFPTQKDQLALLQELHQMRYFDVFELNAARGHWACFVCNHPEKLSELLNDGRPEIAGQLKEKKGKWMFFKRWKTRYFTLSGGSITYDKSNATKASLPVTKIQSVKAVRKGIRDIPKAFEIFTGDQTYMFKAKGHHNVEQWVQCLHIAVARSHNGGSASSTLTGASSVAGVGAFRDGGVLSSATALRGSLERGAGNRRSQHAVERSSAYAGLFDPPLSTPMVVNSSSTTMSGGRIVTDTKL